jgi:hypothetical protein
VYATPFIQFYPRLTASCFTQLKIFSMEKICFVLFLLLTINKSHAQNVGIGTNTPVARLQVVGQGSSSETNNLMLKNSSGDTLLKMLDNGKIGIGYNAPSYSRTFSLGGTGMGFYYTDNGAYAGAIYPSIYGGTSLEIFGSENIVLMAGNGGVGVGIYNPQVGLHVNGAIHRSTKNRVFG